MKLNKYNVHLPALLITRRNEHRAVSRRPSSRTLFALFVFTSPSGFSRCGKISRRLTPAACLRARTRAHVRTFSPSFLPPPPLSLSLSLPFFISAAIARSQACRILTHENGPKGCASHDRCSIRSESTETARQIIYS